MIGREYSRFGGAGIHRPCPSVDPAYAPADASAVVSAKTVRGKGNRTLAQLREEYLYRLMYQVAHALVKRWPQEILGSRLSPHKLRHASGKKCVDVGVDIRVIAEALGHESIETTKLYTQVSFGKTQLMANAISEGWLVMDGEKAGERSDENPR